MTLSEPGLLAIIGVGSGMVGMLLKFFIKSRCKDISLCCGFIKCIRDPLPASAIETHSSQNSDTSDSTPNRRTLEQIVINDSRNRGN